MDPPEALCRELVDGAVRVVDLVNLLILCGVTLCLLWAINAAQDLYD